MLDALARLIHRRRARVLALAGVFAVVAAVLGGPVVGLLTADNDFEDPASESVAARDRIAQATGALVTPSVVALVRTPGPVTEPPGRARVAALVRAVEADRDVARVDSMLTAPGRALVSTDGRATYVAATFRAGADEDQAAERLTARLERERGVTLGGGAVTQQEVGGQVQEDLARAELLAFPALFLLSLLFFRGLVAALLPLLVGGIAIVGTFLAIRLVNEGVGMSVFAINLVTGLGLGLAIDYSLFMVSRYREELERLGPGGSGSEALRATMATAGRTVLFSSLTVAAALSSLLVFPQRFLYSMGIGGVIVALVAAAVALTVLPALLAVLGPRVNALAPARWQRRATAGGDATGFWYRLSRGVMRRPARVAMATGVLLIALGLPFTGIRFTGIDASVLPVGAGARTVEEALQRDFPANGTRPVYLAVSAPRSSADAVARYAAGLRALPGAAAVARPRPLGDDLWRIDVTARGAMLSEAAKSLVGDIRARPAPFPVAVGGATADFVDRQASLSAHLPLALAVVALTTFAILFLMTGSVVLPLKALVMNLLTLSAAFGLLVLIFQDGRLEGLLGYTSQGALESTQPVLLFALAFGLSTDYGVFLLARIKEQRDRGAGTREAVAVGLERTGRIVTAAAVLFCVAIGAFATSEIVFIKELGVGTALAVIIDATIVRALLVPSLMALLGRWNWWAPRPLRRLHDRFGLSEGAPAAARTSAEPV
ncbi:MAG: trehalose monomycolate/heme transporter [Solirubrobacteraceae bacterium]|jgi:RND superfamily putative drug exporter|nr:trehalose monomycolate/heme transporter [Solirubrobacteraceae bacterium]